MSNTQTPAEPRPVRGPLDTARERMTVKGRGRLRISDLVGYDDHLELSIDDHRDEDFWLHLQIDREAVRHMAIAMGLLNG